VGVGYARRCLERRADARNCRTGRKQVARHHRVRTGRVAVAAVAIFWACAGGSQAVGKPPVVNHVHVNGIRFGYRIVGSGRPLVMIPGFAFTMAEWDPKLVAALAARHRVVLFDNRGVATSGDTPKNRLSIGEMASDTAGLIRALHLARTDVMGWSMGGYVAQELALDYPVLVRRLVLTSTDPGSNHSIPPSAKVISELKHPSRQGLLRLLFPRSRQSAGVAWESRIGQQFATLHLPSDSFTVSARITDQQFQASGPGWESAARGSYARLGSLRIPTLIAAGRDDVIVPPRNALLLKSRIRKSQLVRYSVAGHAFLFQEPLRVAARVNRFLAADDPGGRADASS
jgi:pimeloyl-ACP methyl ester carboxylesterase